TKVAAARAALHAARERRVHPGRDEKILTDWNGMMLRAFAEAAFAFGRDDYRQVAEVNAAFLTATLWEGQRLLHSFKDGRPRFNGYLDDYANVIDGLTALYQVTFDYRWLDHATRLADRMIDQFRAPEGGFHFTSADHEPLISRTREF